VRLSLGAGRARIVRQLVTETGVLSLAAGAVGLAIAWIAPGVVLRFIDDWPEPPEFYTPDMTVFAFALGLAVVTALVCGLPPALRATRVSLISAMGERHGQTVSAARLRRVLLATQVALATVLLAGAGLLTRAMGHAMSLDLGFATQEVQILEVESPGRLTEKRWELFWRTFRDTLRTTALPPVAFAELPPILDMNLRKTVRADEGDVHDLLHRRVSNEYFRVLGIRFVAGRPPSELKPEREVAINETAASRLWPGGNAIGRTLVAVGGSDEGTRYTVVGVVADVPVRSIVSVEPVLYRGLDWLAPVLLVRDRSPATVEGIRRLASQIEPGITLRARPLRENVRDSLAVPIAASRVAQAIGALALLLAMFGTFGVFAFAVEERRREIGLRLALGARGPDVMRAMLAANGWSLGGGVAAGLLLAVVGALLLRGYLYGLSPLDPIAYLGVTAVLGFSAAMATLLPTRRAARIDPAVTLRSE
jgi:predicted permease